MPILVRTEGRPRARLSAAWVRRALDRMLCALRFDEVELSVLLTDERTMRRINREHRGEDHATDVLSFPQWEPGAPELSRADEHGRGMALGDLVLSTDTCARQARARGAKLEDEAAMLLAHGLLHLLGLDHRDRTETRRMSARTDALRSAATPRPPRRRASAQAGLGPKRISPRGKK